eukprot:TRINITY_DN5288_c0_g1_i1.p1 TRINITY_DN5288_c0_g1~~TRINITY_DN5288_c0_g1_i1.p1  ORF type:complete len:117 (-),score=15.42 TRINITY_DN5288_c0_g1_i1:37-387(-)
MNKVGSALTPFRIATRRTPKQKLAPKKMFSMQKTHGCEVCHKKFTRSLELKVHMKIHPEKKNYSCHKCDETFKGKHLLIKHEKDFPPSVWNTSGSLSTTTINIVVIDQIDLVLIML